MPVMQDIAYGTLAASGSIEFRPAAGEVWHITRFDCGTAGTEIVFQFTDGSATRSSIISDTNTGAANLWMDNALWARLVNSSASTAAYALYVEKYTTADVPMRALGYALPASGSFEIRPPAGTDWMVKNLMCNPSNVVTQLLFKNASLESLGSRIAAGASIQTPDANAESRKQAGAVSLLLTNASWAKITTANAAASLLVINYAELGAGTLVQQPIIQSMGSGSFLDMRPPLGQIWMVGGWAGSSTSKVTPYNGTLRITSFGINWPRLKAGITVSNGKWMQISVGATSGVCGFNGWQHPLA